MKYFWTVSLFIAGGLIEGCSDEAANPVMEPKTDEGAVTETEVPEETGEEVAGISPEEFQERFPETESVELAELGEPESIEMWGPVLWTYNEEEVIPHELVLEDEEAIRQIVEIMRAAEPKGTAVEDIGPSLLLAVEGEGQFSGPYAFFFSEKYDAFEYPDDTRKRYQLSEEDANAIKELIFNALEEQTGETAGVGVHAAPAWIPVDAAEL